MAARGRFADDSNGSHELRHNRACPICAAKEEEDSARVSTDAGQDGPHASEKETARVGESLCRGSYPSVLVCGRKTGHVVVKGKWAEMGRVGPSRVFILFFFFLFHFSNF
jgi:hypothetical protein